MVLPGNLIELRNRWSSGERFDFYLFYGHKPPEEGVDASCLSQWFRNSFYVDDIEYLTAEHWMMAEKARLFHDDHMLAKILNSTTPRDAKAFGRKVRGFDPVVWDDHKFEIVKRGNVAKFSQDDDLREFLLSTAAVDSQKNYLAAAESKADYQVRESAEIYKFKKPKTNRSRSILVEAAGRDCIWGIGLGRNNPKSQDPLQWRGKNLLGFALTEVRDGLIEEDVS